jgi:tetratricopeptide (TPR) repeat protein
VKPGSDLTTVKAAYRRLAKRYHPDASPPDGKAYDRFLKITEAYHSILVHEGEKKGQHSILRSFAELFSPREFLKKERYHILSTILLNRLALSYVESEKYRDARDILDRLFSEGAPIPATHINLAYVHSLMGEYEQAILILSQAKDIFGPDIMIVHQILGLLKRAGRFTEAYRLIEEVLEEIIEKERGAFYQELSELCSFFDTRETVVDFLKRYIDDQRDDVFVGEEMVRVVHYLADDEENS